MRARRPRWRVRARATARHAPRTRGSPFSAAPKGLLGAFGLFQQLRRAKLHLVDAALQESSPDEVPEQRVRAVRPRAELGVELAPHEPRAIRQLDDLYPPSVG